MPNEPESLGHILDAWQLGGASCIRLPAGHINRTYLVEAGPQRFILQGLNAIFRPEVNLDLAAISSALAAAGLCTPRLVPTSSGALWVTDARDATWRLLTYLQGTTIEQADSPARCQSAGHLLGAFHRALWGSTYQFCHRRLGIHDTPRHLGRLRAALDAQLEHRLYREIAPLAQAILAAAEQLPPAVPLPERVVHGDPKITNILFDEQGAAFALIDLDTLARMPLPLELGDALRSWCSPQGEEVEGPIDLDFFRAALAGYAEAVGELPTPEERAAIPAAVEAIAVELAARFCTDALEERYFGWDPQRFGSAAEHNLVRARAQLALARSIHEQRPKLAQLMVTLWR